MLDCINLLRWLAEPQDELALSGVLRSPFFALADDTLLALRERGRLARALADPPEEVDGDDRARCAHASDTLAELRRAAASLPADALLELALERSAFEASWAPLAGGEQARANIRKLLRIVRTLAGHPLSEVVSYLEAAPRRPRPARGSGHARPPGRGAADDGPRREGARVPHRVRAGGAACLHDGLRGGSLVAARTASP